MGYRVDPNAKNVWVRDNADTMDLPVQTDANSVYFNNGRTMEQEFGKGVMSSNVVTIDSGMEKVIDGTYDGAYESCQMYGKSLVNLINYNDSNINTSGKYVQFNSMVWDVVGKTVTVFNYGSKTVRTQMSKNGTYYRQLDFEPNTKTLVKLESDEKLERIRGMLTNDWTLDEVGLNELKTTTMILEGDYTSQDVPHFTGLCDVKAPILKNVGKNILPKETGKWYSCYFKKGTTFQLTTKDNNPSKGGNIVFVDGSDAKMWMGIDSGATKKTYTLPNDAHKISNQLTSGVEYQLEINIIATPYEPHKTNILETSNDLVLRGLPSGIRDTYDCLTGEYIRRVGERDYQESDESDSNVITDLVKTHYELAEPIVTQIEPPTTPFAYENGHIILESGHEGQSLLPALEYQTVVSRSGQVAMIDKTIQQHERKITLLEKMLVQNIIDIEYKNTLLALKLEINEVI